MAKVTLLDFATTVKGFVDWLVRIQELSATTKLYLIIHSMFEESPSISPSDITDLCSSIQGFHQTIKNRDASRYISKCKTAIWMLCRKCNWR